MRLVSGDPMRDAVRAERVLRTLRDWPQGVALPSLPAFGAAVGLARGASGGPREVERRLREVLAGLARGGRLVVRVLPRAPGVQPWLVRVTQGGRVLHSAAVPACWFDLRRVA